MLFCTGPLSESNPLSHFFVGVWGLSRGAGKKKKWNQGTSVEVCTKNQKKKGGHSVQMVSAEDINYKMTIGLSQFLVR